MDFKDTASKFDFHNLLVAPSITPNKMNNPGIAMFEVDDAGIPGNLKFEFLDLNPTFGSSTVPSNLTFYSLDFASLYDVKTIDPAALAEFRKRLEADNNLTLDFLVRQVGFNPKDSKENAQAMSIYKSDEKLVTSSGNPLCFICEMHKSITGTEESACCAGNSVTDAMIAFEEADHTMFLQ